MMAAKKTPKKTTTTNTTTPSLASKAGVSTDTSDIAIGGSQQYLGVPNGYNAMTGTGIHAPAKGQHGYGATTFTYNEPVAPKYKVGDENAPSGYSREQIANIQGLLVDAGLLGTSFHLGAWDKESAAAYKQVLSLANQAGVDASTALQQFLDAPQQSKANSRAPLVVRLTSDDDLKSIVDQVATATQGQHLSPDEVQRFIAAYHATESSTQSAAYNAAGGAGGSITDAANPQVAAEAFVRKIHPDAAAATDRAQVADTFLKVIQGSAPATASY